MKMFKIRINGNEYQVEVEEVTNAASPAPARAAQPAAARPAPQEIKKPASPAAAPVQNGATTIQAPMPGTILDVRVKAGDKVAKGQTLMILEAMKMENEILAPHDCVIGRVQVEKGASVNAGDVLITLA
ncbi:MAG: biotin/lipoyl-binding protein [Desulforhopalus sp.]|nr:biotin/lipoyl-binding protein [Desulforhopalus sp.]